MVKREKIVIYILEWLESLVQMLIVFILLLLFARPSIIVGASMLPTLEGRNIVVTEKVSYLLSKPSRGDIVSAESNLPLNAYMNKRIIKRIIGISGDHVVVSGGKVYLNDVLLEESYIRDGFTQGNVDVIVPEGKYFVMGDNRFDSNDSRFSIGMIDEKDILSRAYFRIFPFDVFGRIK